MKTIEELKALWKAKLDAAAAICDLAEKANRNFTSEERDRVKALVAEAKDLKEQWQRMESDAAEDAGLKSQIQTLFGSGAVIDPSQPVAKGRGTSLGQQFVEAEAFKTWLKTMAPQGRIPDGVRGFSSPAVEFKDLITGSSDTSAGAFIIPDQSGIFETLSRRALNLRGMISVRQTTSDVIEFVRQLTQIDAAEPIAEATATSGSSGTKPEGSMTWERVSTTVKTIPVWIPATKRALSDAAQVRSLIDSELRADLNEELEDQILLGDGTGENFTGILETDGLLAQPWDTDLFTTTRKAITTIRHTGRQTPTAWLVNPSDAEMIDLLKDDMGRFYYGGPMSISGRTLWGYPVVENEAMPQGTGLLGNFAKAVLWDRQAATIQVSDQHEDFFIRNMVAVLAELRAGFAVVRPSAFVLVDLAEGS